MRTTAILLLSLLGACERPSEPSEPDASKSAASESSEPASKSEPSQPASKPEPPEPAPPEPYVPDPSGFGDPCSETAPCAWNDACMPTRCVAAEHAPSEVACDESAPEPGTCACVEGHCALRPNTPNASEVSCKLAACGLDQGAGKCVEGAMLDANRRTRDEGPACHCGLDSPLCTFTWVEPIPCETVAQCWVSDTRPYHPIARPPALRRKTFEPCKDGEVAPACSEGRCTVRAYSC